MHTIDLLEEALQLAAANGWQVRQEWLTGAAAGACRLRGRKLLFVDRSLTAAEQLEQVLGSLRPQARLQTEPIIGTDSQACDSHLEPFLTPAPISVELRRFLGLDL